MKPRRLLSAAVAATTMVAVFTAGWLAGNKGHEPQLISAVEAAGGTVTDPNGIAPERYMYYPGTEKLAKDEIRVIACGTGLPAARRNQAATCFLISSWS